MYSDLNGFVINHNIVCVKNKTVGTEQRIVKVVHFVLCLNPPQLDGSVVKHGR